MQSLPTDESMVVGAEEGRRGKEGRVESLKQCRIKVLEIIEDDNFLVGRYTLNALVDDFAANNAANKVDILVQ